MNELTFADGRRLSLDRPRVMGILNVTPDSFSDGGKFFTPEAAVRQALTMIDQGADLLDIGGESTRPGAQPVLPQEQINRVIPVFQAVSAELEKQKRWVPLSIDTQDPQVAAAALEAGADWVNDVRGGQSPGMLELVAQKQVPIVLMHMQGTPATMQQNPHYDDVMRQVRTFLQTQAQAAMALGVAGNRIVLDPGIGFGKTVEHNLRLLAALDQLTNLGFAVLLGVSRKRFLGTLGRMGERTPAPLPSELVHGSCALAVDALRQGVRLFRVHDVAEHRQALDTVWALQGYRRSESEDHK